MSTEKKARSKPKRNIRRKLVAILLVTGLTPLLVASIAGTLHITTALKESIGTNFQEIAAQTRDKTDLILRREIADASRLGRTALVLRQEVEKANARYAGKSEPEILEEMKRLDKRWTQAQDDDDLIRQCLESKASSRLNSHLSFEPEKIAEILLTDNQGALIGATGKTSDYYQADEEWWQNAFNDGNGTVSVSPLNYDESAGVVSLDICAPVMDEKGKRAIGVLKVVVNAGYFLNTLREIHFGETGHIHLVSSSGNILVDEENLLPDEKISADILVKLDPSRATWFFSSSQVGCEQSSGSVIIGVAPLETMSRVGPGSFGG
ncbi:MAG: cache domain-containing protein, partial [Planctomycetota bacterium]